MGYKCEAVDYPVRMTMIVRARSSVQNLPQVLGAKFGQVAGYLAELGEAPSGAPFVAYYNMDMNDLDLEIGFPVGKNLAGKDEILAGELPAGKYATCLHIGAYDQLVPAYQALTAWIEANGFQPTGVAYEYYLNDPMETPAQELKTLIEFPLK